MVVVCNELGVDPFFCRSPMFLKLIKKKKKKKVAKIFGDDLFSFIKKFQLKYTLKCKLQNKWACHLVESPFAYRCTCSLFIVNRNSKAVYRYLGLVGMSNPTPTFNFGENSVLFYHT